MPRKGKRAKARAYAQVEEALHRLACGFTVKVRKHFKETVREFDPQTGKKVREEETAVPREDEVYVPPSVQAATYFLANYKPGEQLTGEEQILGAVRALLGVAEADCWRRGEEGDEGDGGALPHTPPKGQVP